MTKGTQGSEPIQPATALAQADAQVITLQRATRAGKRLADAADNVLMQMWGYDENTLNNDVYCVGVSELDALREALKPYMDDDLGEEVEP